MGRLAGRLLALAVLVAALVPATARASGRRGPDIRERRTPVAAARARTLVVPVTIHVATPISAARIARWVRRANEALAPHGLAVRVARVVPVPEGHRRVRRPRDRRRLARLAARDGTLHVFVVDEIAPFRRLARRRRDGRVVRGLYWRFRGLRGRDREFVVVTKHAPVTTFAHEIGHAFGLPHRPGTTNLMCSCRRGLRQTFTGGQGRLMRQGARRFLARARR